MLVGAQEQIDVSADQGRDGVAAGGKRDPFHIQAGRCEVAVEVGGVQTAQTGAHTADGNVRSLGRIVRRFGRRLLRVAGFRGRRGGFALLSGFAGASAGGQAEQQCSKQ